VTDPALEVRLRGALRLGALAIFSITPIELVFTEHTESSIQLLPFAAAALGVVGLLVLRTFGERPRRLARVLFVVVSLVGVLGVWEHFEHNYAFEREIHPNLDSVAAARTALFGAGPTLAPGILILAAGLAWASTFGARAQT